HLFQGRAWQQPALWACMARPDAYVVGVEQHRVGRVEGRYRGGQAQQDEGLEEPAGMGQVPFDRAGLGHRLELAVLGTEPLGQCQAVPAYALVALNKLMACSRGRGLPAHASGSARKMPNQPRASVHICWRGKPASASSRPKPAGVYLCECSVMMYSPRRNWRTAELPRRTVCGRVAIRRISMRLFRRS